MLQASLDSGYFPTSLKKAWIMPIWKGVDHSLPTNYQWLWPDMCWIFLNVSYVFISRITLTRLNSLTRINIVQDLDRVPSPNFSFNKTEILKMLENGANVEVVYLDFFQSLWQGRFGSPPNEYKNAWHRWKSLLMDWVFPLWSTTSCLGQNVSFWLGEGHLQDPSGVSFRTLVVPHFHLGLRHRPRWCSLTP